MNTLLKVSTERSAGINFSSEVVCNADIGVEILGGTNAELTKRNNCKGVADLLIINIILRW